MSLATLIFMFKKNKDESNNEKKLKIYPSDLSWNVLFVAAVSGIIGAKLLMELSIYPPSCLSFFDKTVTTALCRGPLIPPIRIRKKPGKIYA